MALKKGTRLLLWITALGAVIFVAAAAAIALIVFADMPSFDDEDVWVDLTLAGTISDGPRPDSVIVDPENIPLTVHDISATLHYIAADEGVAGIAVELDSPALGLAGAEEIRAGLQAIVDSGKECTVWSKTFDNLSWYLASPCTLNLHPEGVPMAIGLKVSTTYYAGAMEKLGVSGDFERVGTFKSAIETYENTAPSEPTIEMYDTLLDSLDDNFTAGIAEGRDMKQGQIRRLVNDPPVTATTALDRGMVDALTYRDEWEDALPEERKPFRAAHQAVMNDWRGFGPEVAVVHLQGTIVDGSSSAGGLFGGSVIGDATVVDQLEELQKDDDVVAVVLRIDSPGGSALASDVMWRAIQELDAEKPVVASMGGYAASGGYYMAMAARHIVAQPSTLTGSIGVFGGKMAMGGLYEKLGITTWTSQRGELANLYNTTQPFTDPERAKIRERIEAFYDTFVTKAAEGRDMSWDELDAVAGGRVWTGAQAHEVNLVDELGGLELAIERALEYAEVEEGQHVGRRILPRRQTLMEALLDGLNDQQAGTPELVSAEDLLGAEVAAELEAAYRMDQVLTAGGGIAAMLPERVVVQ
jgi:protease IV